MKSGTDTADIVRWQIESLAKAKVKRKSLSLIIFTGVSTAAVAVGLQFLANGLLSEPFFFFFFPAAMIAAWIAEYEAALITIGLCLAAADFLFYQPHYRFHFENRDELIALGFVGLSSAVSAWFIHLVNGKRRVSDLAQQELETTLASIGDAVIVVDNKKCVTFMNPVAERLTGWKNFEARNRPMLEVFNIVNEKTREPAFNPVEKVIREGSVVGLANHTVLISKDGNEYQIEDSAAPIRVEGDEEIAGVILVFRDVTEKYVSERKTTEALNVLEAVVEELSDGIVFVDGDGERVSMNPAALQMHGLSSNEEMKERFKVMNDLFSLQTPDGRNVPSDMWPSRRVLRGDRFHDLEMIVTRKDLTHSFTASYSGTPIRDAQGRVKLGVLTVRDVSKKASTEAALRRAKLEAEMASTLKTSFLANMSHEIRTPMTAVLGFTEVLRNSSLTEAERQDALTRIDRSGRALLKLIDDILDVSKVESGKIEIQKTRFSPLEVASEVIALLRIQAEKKGIVLRLRAATSFPEMACSDPLRIRQILTNLVGNALKFTDEGHVDLCLTAEDGAIVFEVSDTGIGIDPADQAKLFQPFAQADGSINRRFGGTGLGLVLSREIAEALGGSLVLESSAKGKGSKFVARIPAAPLVYEAEAQKLRRPEEKKPAAAGQRPLLGVTLLVAEDVADNQELLRRYLSSEGAKEIEFAGNGEEAVKKAMGGNFDLVLMDIQMPGMDGIQATKLLREKGYRRPIIALTAHAMADEIQTFLASGCDAHIAKPINKKALIEIVSEYAHKPDRASP